MYSVLANICPKESHDLVYSFLSGDIELSRKLQLDLKPLIDALFTEVNPVPVKTAMNPFRYGCWKFKTSSWSYGSKKYRYFEKRT